jgi:tetratricopeptide (TPR) repeat protein
LQCFAEVIRTKKDFYPAYLWSGIISWVLKKYENSVKFYKKAEAIKAYSEEPLHYLDITYRQMGDMKAADSLQDKLLELAKRKLEIDPESVSTLSRAAIAYANIGKSKEALKAVEKITLIAPDDGIVLYNCAATYAILEKKEEAFSFLEKALKMGLMNIIDWLPSDPYFESVRNEPRFIKIFEKFLT